MKNILKLENKFDKAVFWSIIGLLISIIFFALLLTSTKPRVTKVEINGDQESADIIKQQIRIKFNRPIIKDNIETNIQIIPDIDNNITWNGSDLFIIFNKNLQADTEYTILLSSNIQDIYQEFMDKDFEYKFKTKRLELTYLEKGNNTDRIITTDSRLEYFEELIRMPKIRSFDKSGTNLIVVTNRTDFVNDLTLINTKDKKQIRILDDNYSIGMAKIAKSPNIIIFTAQEIEWKDNLAIPLTARYLYIHDIDKNKTEKLDLGSKAESDVDDFVLSQDGRTLLWRDSGDSFYFLADIISPNNILPIGRYIDSGGFSRNNSEIVFLNLDFSEVIKFPYVVLINDQRENLQITDGTIYTIDPGLFNNSPYIFYSEKYSDLDGSKGLFQIRIIDYKNNNKLINNVKLENYSLEFAKISPDDRYLAIEKYTDINLVDYSKQRFFTHQSKPSVAELVIFDTITGEILDLGLPAISPIWE
jgi:hypothetical protein